MDERPELRQAVNTVVARIIQIELTRGETPTAAREGALAPQKFATDVISKCCFIGGTPGNWSAV